MRSVPHCPLSGRSPTTTPRHSSVCPGARDEKYKSKKNEELFKLLLVSASEDGQE